jgi:hypothetical protein
LLQTVLYVDSHGAVFLRRATVSIRKVVGFAKGNDLKQIVELPALNLSVIAGLTESTEMNIQTFAKDGNRMKVG